MRKKVFKYCISILLLCAACLIFQASLFASGIFNQKISLSVTNKPLPEVLKIIEQKAEIRFMYNTSLLNGKLPITVTLTNVTIKQVLQTIINDKQLVFYELQKYVVIARKVDVPQHVHFVSAVPVQEISDNIPLHKIIIDTLHVIDTTFYVDTNRVTIVDTLIIRDTLRETAAPIIPHPQPALKTQLSYSLVADVQPSFQTMLHNPKDEGQPSFASNLLLQVTRKTISIGMGLGIAVQQGTASSVVENSTVDSTLNHGSKTEVHRYQTGDYYYMKDGKTIHEILYDSVSITVPYSWYSYNKTTTRTESKSIYSITWISIPVRIHYDVPTKSKLHCGLALTIHPSVAIKTSGQLYFASQGVTKTLLKEDIQSLALFASLAPTVSYWITPTASFFVCPSVQYSLLKTVKGEEYHGISMGLQCGVIIKISATR